MFYLYKILNIKYNRLSTYAGLGIKYQAKAHSIIGKKCVTSCVCAKSNINCLCFHTSYLMDPPPPH